ncbi:IS66 family insertion sequence element accessory protein TnpB [soil metagenome]
MLSLSAASRYFLYRDKADMRKGIDGLSGLVRSGLKQDPLSGDVFIFFNHRRNQVKLLHWERDGFAIYYKRLERGTYELPFVDDLSNSTSLRSDELMLILQGISLASVQRRKRFHFVENKSAETQAVSL